MINFSISSVKMSKIKDFFYLNFLNPTYNLKGVIFNSKRISKDEKCKNLNCLLECRLKWLSVAKQKARSEASRQNISYYNF